jgi:hypothetical protein
VRILAKAGEGPPISRSSRPLFRDDLVRAPSLAGGKNLTLISVVVNPSLQRASGLADTFTREVYSAQRDFRFLLSVRNVRFAQSHVFLNGRIHRGETGKLLVEQ